MTVEIFHRGQRIASHARSTKTGSIPRSMTTGPSPISNTWNGLPNASFDGLPVPVPLTALVDKILQSRTHPEQGFRSCLGILRLGKTYGTQRLEAAAARAC